MKDGGIEEEGKDREMALLRRVDAHEHGKEDEEPVDHNDEHVFPERLWIRVAFLERREVHKYIGDRRVVEQVTYLKSARKSTPHDRAGEELSNAEKKELLTGMKSTTRKSSTLPPPLNPVTNASFSFL